VLQPWSVLILFPLSFRGVLVELPHRNLAQGSASKSSVLSAVLH
jgi:hypothetical protein